MESFLALAASQPARTLAPGAVSSIQRVPDAYRALAILSTHPRIDADRIVLMGFSHGGLVANAAATDWARKHAQEPEHRFRAIFSFYPSCIGRVERRLRLVVPLRIHAGEKDDWTPAAPCVESMARYRADGGDVRGSSADSRMGWCRARRTNVLGHARVPAGPSGGRIDPRPR